MAFLPYPVIDLYIRAFVNGSQPYSEHRYFIDLRPNTPGHLWLGFALSSKGTVAGADSRLQRAVSVAGNTSRFFQRSIKGSVSGRYTVIPLLGISVRKAFAFPSLLPLCRKIPRRVCMRQRVAALSNGASLAPQEIKIDFAVLPETKSQGLFHQIQKEVTFCGLHTEQTLDFVLHCLLGGLAEMHTDDIGCLADLLSDSRASGGVGCGIVHSKSSCK